MQAGLRPVGAHGSGKVGKSSCPLQQFSTADEMVDFALGGPGHRLTAACCVFCGKNYEEATCSHETDWHDNLPPGRARLRTARPTLALGPSHLRHPFSSTGDTTAPLASADLAGSEGTVSSGSGRGAAWTGAVGETLREAPAACWRACSSSDFIAAICSSCSAWISSKASWTAISSQPARRPTAANREPQIASGTASGTASGA